MPIKFVTGNPDEPVVVTGPGDTPGSVRVARLTVTQVDESTLTDEPQAPAPTPPEPATAQNLTPEEQALIDQHRQAAAAVPDQPFAPPAAAQDASAAGYRG